jgi:hypothetical protein
MHIHSSFRSRQVSPQSGNVMLLCIVLLIPMLIMGLVLMQQGGSQKREISSDVDQARAQFLAEAGIAEAVYSLRHGGNGNLGSQAAPAGLGDGLFWVEATHLADKQVRLVALGMVGAGRAAVDAVVRLESPTWRKYSLFSNQSADLKGQFFLDSYDSRLGTYASQVPGGADHANANAAVGSNANIDIGNASKIYGDLKPGPTGTAITGSSTVSGSTAPSTGTVTLEPVVAPSLPAGGALVVNGTLTLPPGNHRFTSLSMSNGSLLRVPGPSTIVVDGTVNIAPHATVQVASSGEVQFYAGGNVTMGTKAGIETPSQDALAFTMYLTGGAGQTAVFRPHGDFYGTVYGANAEIQLGNDLVVFGAVAGNRIFCQNPKVKVHWDEALADVMGTAPASVDLQCWMPSAFPDDELQRDRRDPFDVLGLEKGTLQAPGQSWDLSGFPQGF